jgi:RND family efflux transporter MFP subunit
MRHLILSMVLIVLTPIMASAETTYKLELVTVTDWKAIFGQVEARDRIPARSRLGGTLTTVSVDEGSTVEQGQTIATIIDEKILLRLGALDAQIQALGSQLDNARIELRRSEDLLQRGVTTTQSRDALRTQVDVLQSRIDALQADRRVIKQQSAEGAVLAPISGLVLNVPVTTGAVVLAGEVIADIGGGGFFLRLAVPERHAGFLKEGAAIQIGGIGKARTGRLAKIYPLIENGRVIADVEVENLDSAFVNARVLVRLPVAQSEVLLVPREAVQTRSGLDFVAVKKDGKVALHTVVLGRSHVIDSVDMVEILSGLAEQDVVVLSHE